MEGKKFNPLDKIGKVVIIGDVPFNSVGSSYNQIFNDATQNKQNPFIPVKNHWDVSSSHYDTGEITRFWQDYNEMFNSIKRPEALRFIKVEKNHNEHLWSKFKRLKESDFIYFPKGIFTPRQLINNLIEEYENKRSSKMVRLQINERKTMEMPEKKFRRMVSKINRKASKGIKLLHMTRSFRRAGIIQGNIYFDGYRLIKIQSINKYDVNYTHLIGGDEVLFFGKGSRYQRKLKNTYLK